MSSSKCTKKDLLYTGIKINIQITILFLDIQWS